MTSIIGNTGSTIAHALAGVTIAASEQIQHVALSRDSTGSVTVLFVKVDDIDKGF